MEEREKQNNEPSNWNEVIKNYAELQKMANESHEKLTSELLKDKDKGERRWRTITIVLAVILFLSNFIWLMEWTSYDYVSQDGEGYNYYNSDIEGDIENGAANQAEEEPEQE